MSTARRNSAVRTRARRAVESFRSCAADLGELERGGGVFAVTRGQWSMIDALLHVLDQAGPSEVSVWTWVVAEYEVEVLARLRIDKRITRGLLVIDPAGVKRNADIMQEWIRTFGADSVRYVVNHAKLARVKSASGWRVLLRGSMNLNFNPRFEQFDLTEGGLDFDLVEEIEEGLPVLSADAGYSEIWAKSKITEVFGSEKLAIFGGLKPWQK